MMEFRRNPRLYNDQINEVRPLRPLPVTPVKQKRSVISRALYPLIMVAAYGLMYYFNQTSLTMLLFPVIMLIPALVVPAIEDRQNWKEAMDVYNAEIIAYNEYLDALDLEFEQIKQSYQLWNAFDFPGTAEELDRCKNLDATLWCKRAEYNDFMNVCVGTYSAKFPVQLEVDYEQMVLHRDDKLKDKIKKLLDKYDVIENTPLIVNLRNHPCLGVCDNSSLGITQEYLAGILLSAIYSYGYDEVKIVVLAKNEPSNSLAEGKYQWTRWLPHCWDEDKKYRFFAATDSEKTNVLLYLTNICQERVAHEGLHLPHYLVLVEDVEFFEKNGIQRFFTQRKNTVGVSLIYISDTKGLPSQAESIVNINKMNSTFTNASMFGLAEIEITPRKAEIYDVEELSRFLSSVQLTDDSRTNELPSLITLFDLYGERSLSPNSIALNWAKNYCYTDGIHAVLGKKSPTEVMDLDMSDEHDGAHMLVAGTTGSGKSEFLQTFVVALASRYSPDEVSFVFIDFKEGGMSESFKELPHNAGSLTNIDDEIDYFAGRAITMLNNERKRRAKLLEPYGQKINRYHEAYHESGEHLVALPHLFIVIDEFAEVIAQCSEFKEMIINLIQDLKGNPVLSHKIDLRIVSFNTQYTEILPFTMVDRIEVSRLKKVEQAEWATFLGTALSRAVEELAEEKAMFKASNAEYTQPNLIVLSDGYPEKEDASVTAKGIKDVQSKIQNERWNCIPIFIGHDFGSNILGDISVPDSYGHKTVITFDSNDKKSDIIEAFKFASMSVGAVGEQAGSPSYKPMSTSELKQKILEAEKRREKIKKNSSQSQKKSFWDKLGF